jgi:hypothetical protein
MKGNRNLAALALGTLIFTGAARAAGPAVKSNPYCVIFQHNVFGLIPPPPADINTSAPLPDITLNGIMTVFDRKYALFKLRAMGGKSYLLGEGQCDGEIKLLSVDDRAGVIRVNNHGVVQTIALAKPPVLLSAPGIAPVAGADNVQIPAETIPLPAIENNPAIAATPVAQTRYAVVGAGNSQGGSSGNNPPSSGASGSQASGASGGSQASGDSGSQTSGDSGSTPKLDPEPWWFVAGRNLEAARIATAGLVASGEAEPYPLTPFTPAGTPANLIGDGQLYFVGAAN